MPSFSSQPSCAAIVKYVVGLLFVPRPRSLCVRGVVSENDCEAGLELLLKSMPDLAIDVPKAEDYVSQVLNPKPQTPNQQLQTPNPKT